MTITASCELSAVAWNIYRRCSDTDTVVQVRKVVPPRDPFGHLDYGREDVTKPSDAIALLNCTELIVTWMFLYSISWSMLAVSTAPDGTVVVGCEHEERDDGRMRHWENVQTSIARCSSKAIFMSSITEVVLVDTVTIGASHQRPCSCRMKPVSMPQDVRYGLYPA